MDKCGRSSVLLLLPRCLSMKLALARKINHLSTLISIVLFNQNHMCTKSETKLGETNSETSDMKGPAKKK